MKVKRLRIKIEITSIIVLKALAKTLSASIPWIFSKDKSLKENFIKELIKSIRKLMIEMNELKKKNTRWSTSQLVEGSNKFVMMWIWCDDPNDKCGDCGSYKDAMKSGIITFKEDKIRDTTIDEPIETNFKRLSIKKLMEDRLERNNFLYSKKIKTFYHWGWAQQGGNLSIYIERSDGKENTSYQKTN